MTINIKEQIIYTSFCNKAITNNYFHVDEISAEPPRYINVYIISTKLNLQNCTHHFGQSKEIINNVSGAPQPATLIAFVCVFPDGYQHKNKMHAR